MSFSVTCLSHTAIPRAWLFCWPGSHGGLGLRILPEPIWCFPFPSTRSIFHVLSEFSPTGTGRAYRVKAIPPLPPWNIFETQRAPHTHKAYLKSARSSGAWYGPSNNMVVAGGRWHVMNGWGLFWATFHSLLSLW